MEDGGIESEILVRPLRIEVREREDGNQYEEEKEREKRQKVDEGGGLLDNLLSKLTSPRTPKTNNNTDDDHVSEVNNNPFDHQDDHFRGDSGGGDGGNGGGEGGGDGGGGGGGVINGFISNFFHRSSEGDEYVKNDGEESKMGHEESVNEGGSSNGSIISSLVPEIVAPAADEASILIHSVVHD